MKNKFNIDFEDSLFGIKNKIIRKILFAPIILIYISIAIVWPLLEALDDGSIIYDSELLGTLSVFLFMSFVGHMFFTILAGILYWTIYLILKLLVKTNLLGLLKLKFFLHKNLIENYKRCPFCDERIRKLARVCKHCSRNLINS